VCVRAEMSSPKNNNNHSGHSSARRPPQSAPSALLAATWQASGQRGEQKASVQVARPGRTAN